MFFMYDEQSAYVHGRYIKLPGGGGTTAGLSNTGLIQQY